MVYDSSSFITMKLYAEKMLLGENNGGNMLYDVRESIRNLAFSSSFSKGGDSVRVELLLVFLLKKNIFLFSESNFLLLSNRRGEQQYFSGLCSCCTSLWVAAA